MFATTQIPIVKSKLIVKSRTESQMKSLLIFKVSMWSFFEIMILPKKSSNFLHVSLHVHHQILSIFIQAAKDPRIAEDVEKLPSMSMDAKRPRLEQSLPWKRKGWWIEFSSYDLIDVCSCISLVIHRNYSYCKLTSVWVCLYYKTKERFLMLYCNSGCFLDHLGESYHFT